MATSTQVDALGNTLTAPGAPANPLDSSSAGGQAPANSETSISETRGATGALDQSKERAADAPPSSECLNEDIILRYRQGELEREQLERLDAHLDSCDPCRELVEIIIADDPEPGSSALRVTTFQRGFIVADRYEIKRFLGRGGMGEVYAAVDALTGTVVALKTVLCTATDDARAIRKLLDEVVNAQRVAHPNVFKIYDLHVHRDANRGRVPFFTMEFIDGESLGVRLRREHAIAMPEVRTIARQLLAGLSAAHAKAVLHLDFKSDNVMLRRDGGEAVIMDFGLSRASDSQSRQRTSERLQAAGTLPYMSLEQLECRPALGPPSDIYSFGVVLYEMLTGERPFRGNTLGAVLLEQLRNAPAPPTRYVPASAALEAFVLKCLARDPSDRFPNATHALSALDAIGEWQQPSGPSATGFARRATALGILLIAIAAMLIAASVVSPERSRPDAGARSSDPEPAQVSSPAALDREAAPSAPDPPVAPPSASEQQSVRPPEPRDQRKTQPRTTRPAARRAPVPVPPEWRGPPPKHVPRPRPL